MKRYVFHMDSPGILEIELRIDMHRPPSPEMKNVIRNMASAVEAAGGTFTESGDEES